MRSSSTPKRWATCAIRGVIITQAKTAWAQAVFPKPTVKTKDFGQMDRQGQAVSRSPSDNAMVALGPERRWGPGGPGHNTGRVFAASPRSANHTSPGHGLIEQVQNLLFGRARTQQVKHVAAGEIDDFRDALSHLGRRLRLPFAQPGVQLLRQSVHGSLLVLLS